MNWLFSRPLAFQLVIFVVGAIIFSQVVSFYLFVNERRTALRDAGIYQAVFRTATIARTLQATDVGIHRQIIRVSSNRRLRYWLSESAAVTFPEDLPQRRRAMMALRDRYPDFADGILFQRGAGALPPRRHPPPGARDRPPPAERRGPPPIPVMTVSVPISSETWLNGTVMQMPTEPRLGWRPGAALALLAGTIIVVLLFLISRVTKPLSTLAEAADKLGRGEAIGPVEERGPREVRITTRAFNVMQERLGRFVEDRTRMLAAISHDLRTPITALRLRAEMLEDGENRERMLETLDTMSEMTEATLNFMRDESASEQSSQVDLSALIDSVCQDFQDMEKKITWETPPNLVYVCRPGGLRRALTNLIDNALKYGATASVSVETTSDFINVLVRDDGPGIPEEKLEEVFRPFARLDGARNTESGSVGLGLSIAQSIVQSHGGSLILTNRPEGGLEAKVSLPL